jgi:hypothetical protein
LVSSLLEAGVVKNNISKKQANYHLWKILNAAKPWTLKLDAD